MHAVTRVRRAVVFTGYVQSLFDHSIRSKLEKYGVDVVRLVDPNRTNAIDIADCELVIILLELVNPRDVQKIKEEAKRQKVRLVQLHRRINDWERAFNGLRDEEEENKDMRSTTKRTFGSFVSPVPKYIVPPRPAVKLVEPDMLDGIAPKEPEVNVVPPAPESSTDTVKKMIEKVAEDLNESHEEPEVNEEVQEFLSLYEEENTRLLEENRQLREINDKWNEKEATLQRELEDVRKQLEAKSTAFVEDARRWQEHALEVRIELQAKIDEAESKLRAAATQGEANTVEKALEPLKQLWKLGYMTTDEVLKKIFKE